MDNYRRGHQPPDLMETNHRHRRQDASLPDYVQKVVVKDSKGLEKILLLPKALDLDRPKRSRTAFAKWQLDALETTFCTHPYLVGEQRTLLARRLGLSETQIKVWYQNRRTKQRKEIPTSAASSVSEKSIEPSPMPSSSSSSLSESSPECLHKWPMMIQSTQQQPPSHQDLFGQAFQHYHHPAASMYHQIMQSYNTSHSVAAGNLSVASATHSSVPATSDRHQHRVY